MTLFDTARYTAIKERIAAIEALMDEIGKRLEQYPTSEARTSAEKQMLAMALNLDNLDANVDVMSGEVEEPSDVIYDQPWMHELTQPASLEPSGPWPTDSEPDYSGYYEQEEDVDNEVKKYKHEDYGSL